MTARRRHLAMIVQGLARQSALRSVMCALLMLGAWSMAQGQEPEPIVIGQSLPLGAADDGNSRRITQGVQAQIEAINARGGVQGRRLVVKTLDNGNDPVREAANIRSLVQQHRAVALLGCQGDDICKAASATAAALGVALVGPMAPAIELPAAAGANTFRIRAPFSLEAALLARQLRSLAVRKVALVVDASSGPDVRAQLLQAMEREGLSVGVVLMEAVRGGAGEAAMQLALQALGRGGFQAAVLQLSVATTTALLEHGLHERPEWPLMLFSSSTPSLTSLMNAFKSRVFGFTVVVPSPESGSLSLVRVFESDVDRHADGAAATYAGMEAYINARVLFEALRRAGKPAQAESVLAALRSLPELDLGGFRVAFRPGRASGSDFVDIAVRSRSGGVVR